jgi:hypothetical protein
MVRLQRTAENKSNQCDATMAMPSRAAITFCRREVDRRSFDESTIDCARRSSMEPIHDSDC